MERASICEGCNKDVSRIETKQAEAIAAARGE